MDRQQVLLYSTGNHIRYPVINHNGKEYFEKTCIYVWGFPGGTGGKNAPAPAVDVRDAGWIPGLGRSSGEGNGNPLQNSPGEFPWAEEPDRLWSTGSQRIGHD